MSSAHTDRELRQALTARPGRHGHRAGRQPTGAAVLRENWPAVVLLVAGLALRVLAQFAYRPAIFYIDTPRYLLNQAAGQDPLGYKAVLRAITAAANLDAVIVVQHLLGLAMSVVIYLLLRRRGTGRWLAALAIAPVLLDAYQVQTEQTLMPDIWFEAMIVAGLGRAAVLCVAFAVPILAYSAGSYLLTGAFQLSHTGVTSFYGRTAAAVDCQTIRLPAAERGMCPTRAQQLHGPDWLEYASTSPIRPYYNTKHQSIAQTDSQISDFNHRVLTQQPLRLLAAYGHDLLKLFAVSRTQSAGDTPISRWQFQAAYPYFPPWTSVRVVRGAINSFGGGRPVVWLPGARFLRAYQLDGGYTSGPLLAVFVLAGLAGSAVLLRRRLEPRTRQLGLACLLFLGSGVFVLLVSDLFQFSWRYQLPALVTLAPAGALGISALLSARKRAS